MIETEEREGVRRAFALCLRESENGLSVLLVRTSSGQKWTFPHGHVKPGENPAGAALRELEEEAGYRGITIGPISSWRYKDGGSEAFLVLNSEAVGMGELGRLPSWVPWKSAAFFLRDGRHGAESGPLIAAMDEAGRAYFSAAAARAEPASQEPHEGRWCPDERCRGLLSYKRTHRGDSYQTWVCCPFCGWKRELHDEPDYPERGER